MNMHNTDATLNCNSAIDWKMRDW